MFLSPVQGFNIVLVGYQSTDPSIDFAGFYRINKSLEICPGTGSKNYDVLQKEGDVFLWTCSGAKIRKNR